MQLTSLLRCSAGLALIAVGMSGLSRAADAGVAVVHSAAWHPGDTAREGAEQFALMLSVADVQKEHSAVGVIGVGNRQGLFSLPSEAALRYLALHGVPIAKLGRGEEPAADPMGIFLDAGLLTENEASAVMTRCLAHYGVPPAADDPDHPTRKELNAIRSHLRRFQEAFAVANAHRVALN